MLAVFVTEIFFFFLRQDGYPDTACDQVHDYLASIAQKRPSELSKVIYIQVTFLVPGHFFDAIWQLSWTYTDT